jgi:hypothetical protein
MNGYTTVKVNGNEVGLLFAYPSIRWFSEASEEFADAFFMPGETGDFSVEGLAKLIECAYRNNCIVDEVKPELKYRDFYLWVTEVQDTDEGQTEMIRIIEVYAQSSVIKKMVKNLEEQKKSLTQTDQSTLTISNPPATESLESNPGSSTE